MSRPVPFPPSAPLLHGVNLSPTPFSLRLRMLTTRGFPFAQQDCFIGMIECFICFGTYPCLPIRQTPC